MCIAIPMKVIAEKDGIATCEREGIRYTVDLALVGEVNLGDDVLVAQSRAVRVIRPEEAAQINKALAAAAAVAAGNTSEETIRAGFSDLVDKEPQLPPHLRSVVGKKVL